MLYGLLSNKNIRIPTPKKFLGPPTPRTMRFLGGKGGYLEKLSNGSKTSDMTSEGLGESADTCTGKFPLVSMGDERTVKRAQTVSEDPHRRERKFVYITCVNLYVKIL
jgi:hypothetical protein